METDSKTQTVQLPTGLVENVRVIIASTLLIIFFFVPWIEIQWFAAKIINYSGWDLPKVASDAQNLLQSGNQLLGTDYQSKVGDNAYILYLIPGLAGLLIYFAFQNTKKYFGYIELAIVLVAGYVCYKFFNDLDIDKKFVGIGLVGTFAVSIFMLFDGIKNLNKTQIVSGETVQNVSASMYDVVMTVLLGLFAFCSFYALYDIFIVGH